MVAKAEGICGDDATPLHVGQREEGTLALVGAKRSLRSLTHSLIRTAGPAASLNPKSYQNLNPTHSKPFRTASPQALNRFSGELKVFQI